MRFKKGQEVVCTKGGNWRREVNLFWGYVQFKPPFGYAPQTNEIVTVDGYNDLSHMFLAEYAQPKAGGKRPAYEEAWFQPVVPQEEIEKLLESITEKSI